MNELYDIFIQYINIKKKKMVLMTEHGGSQIRLKCKPQVSSYTARWLYLKVKGMKKRERAVISLNFYVCQNSHTHHVCPKNAMT